MGFNHKIVIAKTFFVERIYFVKCLFKKYILGKKTFLNKQTHHGNLPIRVLQHNVLDWLEKVSPEYFQLMMQEIQNNSLSRAINYNIDNLPIIEIVNIRAANINRNREINTYENFNAYLWCICYSLMVSFDEMIQKPQLKGNYKSNSFDKNNQQIRSAIKVFEYGMSLRTSFSGWDYSIPNPEKYDCKYSFYIEKANSLFISAMFFVLSHEIGHSYYNHVLYRPATAEQSLRDELDADNFAIRQVLSCRNPTFSPTLKYGAVAGMCALLFLSPKLYKNDTYPDADDRIKNVMEQLNLPELDLRWGIASLAFRLWGNYYGIIFNTPDVSENYQELFYDILLELNTIKRGERRR